VQELIWLIEPLRVWLDGGSMKEIAATEGFWMLALIGVATIPSTLIAWGMGAADFRETPLAAYLGLSHDPDEGWAERARDRDGDGLPDF
jgi:hypothetical protein